MSEFDAFAAAADAACFEVFGDDATVQRGTDAPVPVRVVVTRGVERYGEFGQVVTRVTTAMFRASEWQPRPGDAVTLADGMRKVESIDADDGLVVTAVLHG